MKIDRILEELIIFARERDGDEYPEMRSVLKAADRHLDAINRVRARRARYARKGECERCGGRSTSGILCWHCLAVAPIPIATAFREAVGLAAMRNATEKVRVWIRTSAISDSPSREATAQQERMAA
jgi:hypothetical protein